MTPSPLVASLALAICSAASGIQRGYVAVPFSKMNQDSA
jgi:hypothetical protein